VIVEDFELKEPLDEELSEDFDENEFLIKEVDEFVEKSLIDLNYTQLCNSTQNNATENTGFLSAFTSSITVILVSEIGDKTFFIAAILAMRNSKLIVFIAALSALYLMTILSALLGWVVTTFIPREITYYTCTAIMFLFGLKMLWEAWRMKSDETEETQREVEQELGVMEGQAVSTDDTAEKGELNSGFASDEQSKDPSVKDKVVGFMHKYVLAKSNSNNTAEIAANDQTGNQSVSEEGEKTSSKKKTSFIDRLIDDKCAESACFSAGCLRIFKLFINCFSMTFIAEWGDRSQLATIVLAGINNVWGVIIGGCLGHTMCTGAAVLVGMIVARFISARVITFIGALVFIGFAIASLFIDPNEGIDKIPDIPGYDNCTRLLNHNIKLTLRLEETDLYG